MIFFIELGFECKTGNGTSIHKSISLSCFLWSLCGVDYLSSFSMYNKISMYNKFSVLLCGVGVDYLSRFSMYNKKSLSHYRVKEQQVIRYVERNVK